MKATATIEVYWDAVKGHKGFYYPDEDATYLPCPCIVEGEVMPWLVPTNMLCIKVDKNKLIFILKRNVTARG